MPQSPHDLLDPERMAALLGSILGSATYGLYTFVQAYRSGQRLTRSDYFRLGLNLVAAGLFGSAVALAMGPQLIGAIPLEQLRATADPFAVGFVIGALGWELFWPALDRVKRVISGDKPSAPSVQP